MTTVADELLARINCFGMGAWITGLFASFGQSLPNLGAGPGAALSTSLTPDLSVRLARAASGASDPRDGLVLDRVEGAAAAPMPVGLDPATETPASAAAKLSTDTAGGSPAEIAAGDTRVSFFLGGGRIVELRFFAPSMVGFDRLVLARLGAPLDWRDSASR